jgi:hypothetical protein
MKPFMGITRLFRPDLPSRVARVSFVVLKGISSTVRCKSTLDNSQSLSESASSDLADNADSSQNITAVNANASGQKQAKSTRWTPEEIHTLKDSVAKGMTIKAIAALLPTRSLAGIGHQLDALRHNEQLSGEKGHTRWSAESVKLLLKLHAEGLSAFQLRVHFPDRSTHAIRRALITYTSRAHGVSRDKSSWTHDDETRLTELYAQGVHKRAISEVLGRSIPAIEARAAKLGLLQPKKICKPEEIAEVMQMRRDKVPFKRIAELLGRPRSTVAEMYHKQRPLRARDARVQKSWLGRLSIEELESVSALRAQDISWADIGRRYPMYDLDLIVKYYRRFAGHDLTPTEVREIERLRKGGTLWREIIASNKFYHNSMQSLLAAYRRTVARQSPQQ